MNRNLLYLSVVALSLSLMRCGVTKVSNNPVGPGEDKKLILTLFAGFPCKSCNTELPEIRDKLAGDLAHLKDQIHTRVYVVAGENWSVADEKVAKAYGAKLNVPFEMLPDDHCLTEYKKLYPELSKCFVPATVIQTEDGEVIEKFKTGKIPVDHLMERLKEHLK